MTRADRAGFTHCKAATLRNRHRLPPSLGCPQQQGRCRELGPAPLLEPAQGHDYQRPGWHTAGGEGTEGQRLGWQP